MPPLEGLVRYRIRLSAKGLPLRDCWGFSVSNTFHMIYTLNEELKNVH